MPKKLRHLGYLPDHLIPLFLNSLDVLVIVNRLSDFGNFSYPVKLYEAMSCRIPVVVTETGPARWILGNQEQFLAAPEDPLDLAAKTRSALVPWSSRVRSCRARGSSPAELFERALLSEDGRPGPDQAQRILFPGDLDMKTPHENDHSGELLQKTS